VKIIVAVYDEHESAARALERATELASGLSVRLVVLSVAPPVEPARPAEALQPSFESVRPETARLAENPILLSPQPPAGSAPVDRVAEHLERARDVLARAGAEAELVSADTDDPDALLELAAKHGADLLVIGAHRPNLWQRLVGGSDEGQLARQAACDVLIVH
jgi:nucleotide-binding universal stress UspA family protein